MDPQSNPTPEQNRRVVMNTEAEIQQLMMEFAAAIRKGDLDEIMSFYSDDVVAFDMLPPLQINGKAQYRKSWEQYTSSAKFPFQYEFRNMNVVASSDVGFCHCLIYMSGSLRDGSKMETWIRETACFRKIHDKWFIEHEQQSAPVDMNTGKALFDLKPEPDSIH